MMACEHPRWLPDVDENDMTPLRQWREKHFQGNPKAAAAFFGVSQATLYRYESGNLASMDKVNRIVQATGGQLRYRDLIGGFNPEFA